MSWLQGGPFFELSFLIEETEHLQQTLNKMTNSSEVQIVIHYSPEMIHEFYEGHPFDEDDVDSKRIHQIGLNVTVNTNRVRRALLFVERINTKLLCFTLCFYGSELDAHEWDQSGIRQDEMKEFYQLLRNMYDSIQFIIGGSAFEKDVKVLFGTDKCWPDETYSIENIKSDRVANRINDFNQLIINKNLYKKLELDFKGRVLNQLSNGIEMVF